MIEIGPRLAAVIVVCALIAGWIIMIWIGTRR